eukprot:Ihof_evm10s40 gene=Ihof_evmTU10s40
MSFIQRLQDLWPSSVREPPQAHGSSTSDDTQLVTLARVTELQKNMKEVIKRYKYRISSTGEEGLSTPSPYLVDIVEDLWKHIDCMWKVNPEAVLREELYARVVISSLEEKVSRLLWVLKTLPLDADSKAKAKKEVNMLTLILSHTLQDLRHIYKDYILETNFRITKLQAERFWVDSFGNAFVVTWEDMVKHLNETFGIKEAHQLKATMDITENDHISWLEFDVFTRLFQPWERLVSNWAIVTTHPAYQEFMTYEEGQNYLRAWTHKPGTYLFRLSCTRLGHWAIGYVNAEGRIVQTIPQNKSLYQALIDGSKTYLYPAGQNVNIDMRSHFLQLPPPHIKTTKEQYEMYRDIDTLFEICKICSERSKDSKLEPCGHLICHICLREWTKQKKTICPFCRHEIRDASRVTVDGYATDANESLTETVLTKAPVICRTYNRQANASQSNASLAPIPKPRPKSSLPTVHRPTKSQDISLSSIPPLRSIPSPRSRSNCNTTVATNAARNSLFLRRAQAPIPHGLSLSRSQDSLPTVLSSPGKKPSQPCTEYGPQYKNIPCRGTPTRPIPPPPLEPRESFSEMRSSHSHTHTESLGSLPMPTPVVYENVVVVSMGDHGTNPTIYKKYIEGSMLMAESLENVPWGQNMSLPIRNA